MQELPVLRLPNYSKLFTLFVHERDNQVLEVLTQEHANKHRPIAFYSIQLDLVAQCAYLNYLKVIVAAANLVEASADLTLGNDIYLQAPHAVQSLNWIDSTFLHKPTNLLCDPFAFTT